MSRFQAGLLRFELTADHIKLLRRLRVGWQDCEYGAPEIDPKRPYGNSSVEYDIAEILGWEITNEGDGLTDEQSHRAYEIHRSLDTALQIVLATGVMEPGAYVADKYRPDWHRA